jgi:hypothetical protein
MLRPEPKIRLQTQADEAVWQMPSLMRFLTVLGVIAGLCFGALYALATLVTPRPREMTVSIPSAKLRPAPVQAEAESPLPRTAGAEPQGADVP